MISPLHSLIAVTVAVASSARLDAPPRAPAAAPLFEFVDLGAATGAPQSVATSISPAGQVGGHIIDSSGRQRGIMWHAISDVATVTVLGAPPGVPATAEISVVGLNASGQAAVSAFLPAFAHQSAHRWENGIYTSLGTLGGSLSLPSAINAAGHVVGVSTIEPSTAGNFGTRAAWIHADGRIRRLDGLAPGVSGAASAISDGGVVVGVASPGEQHRGQAFLHDSANGARDMGALAGQIARSEARDVNEIGVVVGSSGTGEMIVGPGGVLRQRRAAVVWDRGRIIKLPSAPGYRICEANAINDAGWVVGSARAATSPGVFDRAQLWIGTERFDLTSLMPAGTGWDVLISADDVAPDGTIVGTGRRNGAFHAYALVPIARDQGGGAMLPSRTPGATRTEPTLIARDDFANCDIEATSSICAASSRYEVVDLGLGRFAAQSWAWDVSASGVVVGSLVIEGTAGLRAFTWAQGVLTIHDPPSAGPHLAALAVDDLPGVVGCEMVQHGLSGASPQAMRIIDGQASTVVAGQIAAWANDTSAAGLYCGASDFFSPQIVDDWFTVRGFVTESGGLATPLTLGGTHSEALAIDAVGNVVGGGFVPGNLAYGAFRHDAASATTAQLPGLGGGFDVATSSNDSGIVVGFSRLSDGRRSAVRWVDSAPSNLGTLGGFVSEAWGVNGAGVAVGMSWTAEDEPRAFIHYGTSMIDLNGRLADADGWIVTHARSINDAGWIVGWGRREGRTEAVLLRPISAPSADFDRDGDIDGNDLAQLLGAWGSSVAPYDLDRDGDVGAADLTLLLAAWGPQSGA